MWYLQIALCGRYSTPIMDCMIFCHKFRVKTFAFQTLKPIKLLLKCIKQNRNALVKFKKMSSLFLFFTLRNSKAQVD